MGALNPFSCPKGGSDSGCLLLEGGARPRQLTGGQLAAFPLDPAMGFSLVGQGQGTEQGTVPANPTFPHSQATLFPRRQGAEGAPISWQASPRRLKQGGAGLRKQDLGSKTTLCSNGEERQPSSQGGLSPQLPAAPTEPSQQPARKEVLSFLFFLMNKFLSLE